jgi:hypothetical protein
MYSYFYVYNTKERLLHWSLRVSLIDVTRRAYATKAIFLIRNHFCCSFHFFLMRKIINKKMLFQINESFKKIVLLFTYDLCKTLTVHWSMRKKICMFRDKLLCLHLPNSYNIRDWTLVHPFRNLLIS